MSVREAIADRIRELIRSGALRPGDRLPSERELARRFRVSRAAVREAVQKLAAAGFVEINHGIGVTVTEWALEAEAGFTIQNLMREAHQVEQLLEMRRILEGDVAALAARRATQEDLEYLSAVHREMEELVARGETAAEADYEFHLGIAKASKNEPIIKIMTALSYTLRRSLALHRVKTWRIPGRPEQVVQEHATILEAIRQGNPEKAKEAMLEHLQSAQRVLFPVGGDSGHMP